MWVVKKTKATSVLGDGNMFSKVLVLELALFTWFKTEQETEMNNKAGSALIGNLALCVYF